MLKQSITNLLHGYGYNKRGNCAVIGVPREGVQSMPDIKWLMEYPEAGGEVDFYVEDIVLKAGFQWLDLSKGQNLNIDFSDEQKISNQGSAFAYDIALPVPHDDFTTRGRVFRAYQNREWILIVKERSGSWRVIGSLARGAVFSNKLNSGTVQSNSSVNSAGFIWECGEDRACYTGSFLSGTYWFRVTGTDGFDQHRLEINESVSINWGDGVYVYYPISERLADPAIVHDVITNDDGDFEILVYHHNLATAIDMHGDTPVDIHYNGTITDITGTLPASLKTLILNSNYANAVPITPLITRLELEQCAFDEPTLADILDVLDIQGKHNGLVALDDQVPPVTPSGAMATSKAHLEAKGWTVTY